MIEFLQTRFVYVLIFFLLIMGIYGILGVNNFMKKLMAMNIMQVAVIIFFLTLGQKHGATIPILVDGANKASQYVNPLPHALMLTAIVVSLSTTGVALALLMKMQEKYSSIEEDEVLGRMNK